jgi:hypothetical protein
MKGGNFGHNGSDLDKRNILKPTFDTLMEEGPKAFEAYCANLEELFLSCCEVTWHGTVLKDTTPIIFMKPKVTPEVQSAINEGRLKFAENPQIKLDKDPFSVNMNMIELKGKKVLVRPSQTETTKGKDIIIGEERPKSPKDGQWQKNEGSKLQRRPKATFDIFMAKYKEGRAEVRGHKN